MKADFILISPRDGSSGQVETETFQVANITHVPRVGERICHGGRDYDVYEVTWDYEEGTVCIGARF
jgi:hypothetical protein